jgi:hypothetical protein
VNSSAQVRLAVAGGSPTSAGSKSLAGAEPARVPGGSSTTREQHREQPKDSILIVEESVGLP